MCVSVSFCRFQWRIVSHLIVIDIAVIIINTVAPFVAVAVHIVLWTLINSNERANEYNDTIFRNTEFTLQAGFIPFHVLSYFLALTSFLRLSFHYTTYLFRECSLATMSSFCVFVCFFSSPCNFVHSFVLRCHSSILASIHSLDLALMCSVCVGNERSQE